jgi:hypothetical protein
MCHVGPTLVDALTERKEQPDVIFPLSQPVGLKSLPFFYSFFSLFFFARNEIDGCLSSYIRKALGGVNGQRASSMVLGLGWNFHALLLPIVPAECSSRTQAIE